ncbi:Type IV pilus biogenesis protein PilM [Alkalibacterium sp. AK22]|uniref:type IV pilus biogenesis protein PilM n=1 Tax=Alkalibacterium sp. AK22 TaxID=1229520 RepID=UPI000452DBF7|nr:pilus assembly protein PilM [Alkalibacterium sp. AK22]EXJ22417.1 Type IV pilus biogenesis protein PilM [Alkalibacterium sp. AK22]
MLFKSKMHLHLQFLEKSVRYLVTDASGKNVIEKDELIFESFILQEGKLVGSSFLKTRLDALIKEKKWKQAKVSILLPDDSVTIRKETIPAQLDYNEIKDYLNLHVNQSIRLPFEDPRIDFEVIEKNESTQTLFLAAYPGEQVRQYLDLLEAAHLQPEVADLSSLCIYRILLAQSCSAVKSSAHVMVLQWNPIDTSITVFNKGIPQFNRHTRSQRLTDAWTLSKESRWIWKRSERELSESLEDQLNGLERFFEFYRYSVMDGQGSISEIVLSGYFPEMTRLKQLLDERFSVPVNMLELPEGVYQAESALYGLTLREHKPKKRLLDSAKRTEKSQREKNLHRQNKNRLSNLETESEGDAV